MRVAILETVKTQAGFEQEFDRLIIGELKKQGHEPVLYLPEASSLPVDFGVPVEYLAGGQIVDYEGAGKLKKIWLSAQRELRRIKWFDSAFEKAQNHEVDAIILTTATYRYLRSLVKSKLKNSPIPVIFIFLGVNPQEKPKFVAQARQCLPYKNIKLRITSLRDDFKLDNLTNVTIVPPPVLVPAGVEVQSKLTYKEPIRVGFYGHYRKGEKDVGGIVKAFIDAKLGAKAKLVVQAAPTTAEDAEHLEAILKPYSQNEAIEIIRGKLTGKAWYAELQSADVLLLPYMDERYLYNWSAVYFNALGLYKPVLATKFLNPEILGAYEIGAEVNVNDLALLSKQLQDFLSNFQKNLPHYEEELQRVNADFSTKVFLTNILK